MQTIKKELGSKTLNESQKIVTGNKVIADIPTNTN